MSTYDSPFSENNFHFDINESTSACYKENLGKKGNE